MLVPVTVLVSSPGACFSKVPKLFGRHNSLCIFKMKASRGTKLCSYFYFYSLCNIWKDQLYRISRSYFTNGFSFPKVLGTFEKRAPGLVWNADLSSRKETPGLSSARRPSVSKETDAHSERIFGSSVAINKILHRIELTHMHLSAAIPGGGGGPGEPHRRPRTFA